MTTQIDPLTGFSAFKSIVAPLNSNDLLDAILYRSNSIADNSIESITSGKKPTNSNKSVALKSTDNQFQTNTQSVLLSNANNLSVSSLQSASLNPLYLPPYLEPALQMIQELNHQNKEADIIGL